MTTCRQPAVRSGRGQRGLSLIELMISITLGLIILAALLTVFNQNSRSFRQNDATAQMQDNARFAMEALTRDLSMAGYLGGMYNAQDIQLIATTFPSNDCGAAGVANWSLQVQTVFRRVEFINNATATTASATYPCLDSVNAPVYAGTDNSGTDVVAIRRVAGQSTADMLASATSPTLNSFTYYLQTNGTQGSLTYSGNLPSSGKFTIAPSSTPLIPPMSFYKWVPRIYFIRSYAHTPGDNTPALCRMELQSTSAPSMQVECLADGVENMQIEWGLDTDNDCVPDAYVSSFPTIPAGQPGQLATQAVTARIWLLVRTTQIDAGFVDNKVYTLAGNQITSPGDSFHRHVYSTTVQLRNPVGTNPCGSNKSISSSTR